MPPPSFLSLSASSTTVEDVDEEIFLLYTRKLQLSTTSAPSGLGFIQTNAEVLPIVVSVTSDTAPSDIKGKKGTLAKEVTVEMEVWQDLEALRHRKGNTASVLWRVSLYLAKFLLSQHHFPSLSSPPLFPTLSNLKILELGSGTGFLGIFLLPLLSSSKNWTFTDQIVCLPLVMKNLKKNEAYLKKESNTTSRKKLTRKASSSSKGEEVDEYSVKELDWLDESLDYLKFGSKYSSSRLQDPEAEQPPDIIFAVDCIYNPHISLPLVHTICRNSGPQTCVLVASELRDEEPLELFLGGWLKQEGWKVERIGFEGGFEVGGKEFVVWVGWKE